MKHLLTVLLLIPLFPATRTLAGIIRVPLDQPSIQAGINAAVNGDTVLVADSTYYENINFAGKAITVASYYIMDLDTNHINNTIINGSQPTNPDAASAVSFTSGEDTTSVICGFTITGGTGTLSDGTSRVGGGIYCYASGSRITHNTIVNNTITHTGEARGGGIGTFPWGNNRYTIIENNIIESNTCISDYHAQGSGIYMPQGKISQNKIRLNLCQGNFVSVSVMGGGIHGASDSGDQRYLYISENLIESNVCINSANYSRGGGIFAWGGVIASLINNTINDNRVASLAEATGGGVALMHSQAPSIVQGNLIAGNLCNTFGSGGGMRLFETQGIQIVGNMFNDNGSAVWGGGISTWNASGTRIIGNEFRGNTADTSGGGLDIEESNNSIIDKNLFRQNTAKYGAGIFKFNGNSTITNNIIVENEAQQGGGIQDINYPSQSYVTQFINNTLTGNVANNGGGIYSWGVKFNIMNTICWGNSATFAQEIYLDGGTMDIAYSDIRFGADSIRLGSGATLNWLDGNISKEPMLRGDSLMLSDSSSCIGAGTLSYQLGSTVITCPPLCFLGRPRPFPPGSNPPDMGACESFLGSPLVGLDHPISAYIPESYGLKQNYPNPFNPMTVISWFIPNPAQGRDGQLARQDGTAGLAVSSPVKLSVYNLSGQRVTTLVDERQPAGNHSIEFDGSVLASGVYFYRLEAGDFVQTRKMLLVR